MKEIDGDIVELSRRGMFEVILQNCNCFCIQGKGLAPIMNRHFNTLSFKMEAQKYKGSMNKLGTIDYEHLYLEDGKNWTKYPDEMGEWVTHTMYVVNAYAQYKLGKSLDYEALTLCLRKINHTFKGKKIGVPKIGAGISGGNWEKIRTIIEKELVDLQVIIINYKR